MDEKLLKSIHYGHKTAVAGTLVYEGWNQLELFDSSRNREVEINVGYIKWKTKRRKNVKKTR